MSVTFAGVPKDSIGTLYTFAAGYDDGTGNVVMVGYVLTAGSEWTQTTDLQDEQSLISVASPNQIDRSLAVWPKVTQGDWTGGEQQLTFINPQRYRSSDGNVDISRPGQLQLFPGPRTSTYTSIGTSNLIPLMAFGDEWWCGVLTSGGNLVSTGPFSVPTVYTICDGTEIYATIPCPAGVVAATANGIWTVSGSETQTQISSEGVPSFVGPETGGGSPSNPASCPEALAYFNSKVFFITPDQTQIKYVDVDDGESGPIDYITFGEETPFEENVKLICSTANGLFYATYKQLAEWELILYVNDGITGAAGSTRIGDLYGKLEFAQEIYGTTYILVRQFQSPGFNDFTLLSLQGTVLTKLLDYRWVPDEFKAVGNTGYHGGVWGDGRFVYIGWPGQWGFRIEADPNIPPVPTRCTGFNPTGSISHKIFTSNSFGIIDANAYVSGGETLVTINEYFEAPTSGLLTFSDIDFDTPGEDKAFRAVYVELESPLPAGASSSINYAVDGSDTYLPTVQIENSSTRYLYRIPAGTLGGRISIQLGMVGGIVIRSVAVEGTLGRAWKPTVQCHREQQLLDSSIDSQGKSSQELLGNIENAFESAARIVYLYVPSLTDPDMVEQTKAVIQTYTWHINRPYDDYVEGTMDITLTETF